MFTLNQKKLENLGAMITTREIAQQPDLWDKAYTIYTEKRNDINNFFEKLTTKHGNIRVIFTGAGTSAYIGDTITPYLKGQVDERQWDLNSIPTTTLVSNPYQFLKSDIPTLLVSFARSGNSPESIASVELGEQIVKDFYQLTITCAEDGELANRAKDDENNLLLLMPELSNDQGFAMTGSFSCMTLTALMVFDTVREDEKKARVKIIREMGLSVLERVSEIQKVIDNDFNRIIYLGSGSLGSLAREAQLKVLELTAGKIVTAFDSSLGFRHGPKSFINKKTIVFVFVSSQPYTRKYDLDILKELQIDGIAQSVIAIERTGEDNYDGDTFSFGIEGKDVPDAYLALPYIIYGQTVSLLSSVKVGNKPDTPSPTGTVNRVVKGVTIYDYKG